MVISVIILAIVVIVFTCYVVKSQKDDDTGIQTRLSNTTYWERYKQKESQKAADIENLTNLNFDSLNDSDVKEIISSISRWSDNIGVPISELKTHFINGLKGLIAESNGELTWDAIISDMRNKQLKKEAQTFRIKEENTICQIMINIISDLQVQKKEQSLSAYSILNFYLDCAHCHKQEIELSKATVLLPIKKVFIDSDNESDEELVEKYHVRQLPKLILIDSSGNEIKRWLGITSVSEINSYLFQNGFVEQDDDDTPLIEEEHPRPLHPALSPSDMAILQTDQYQGKVISIAADGGTREQTLVKLELLLGKRQKTKAMIDVENKVREYFQRLFADTVSSLNIEGQNPLIAKLVVTTELLKISGQFNDSSTALAEEKKKLTELANAYGISVNLIEQEEQDRILNQYQ